MGRECEKKSNKKEEEYNTYLLHKMLEKIEWLEWNQRPPVNYPLIVIVSIIASIITQIIITQL